jgi:hypothetical protein
MFFQQLFLAKDAPVGKTWLRSTRILLLAVALHHLALESELPLVSKARDAYGHFCTSSQMNKVPGRYWLPEPDLSASIQQAYSQLLNPQPATTPMARLNSLRSEAVGGILLVTQQFAADGTASSSYLTIVAAPALATLGPLDDANPPGYSLSDFWDNTVLQPFGLPVNQTLHCPLMAAAEGFSRKVKLPGITDLIKDSQPLFFPSGEQAASLIQLALESHYCAFYLPEVCGLPLGLVWPTTTGYNDFLASI